MARGWGRLGLLTRLTVSCATVLAALGVALIVGFVEVEIAERIARGAQAASSGFDGAMAQLDPLLDSATAEALAWLTKQVNE